MISVVVPTFNRSRDLDRCLRALQQQTLEAPEFEVVVVDDGSRDNTLDVLRAWAERWPSLRFFSQSNAGPAAARNAGIANARGTVIAFTDDDCVPAADWLERIRDRYARGEGGCIHGPITSALPASTFVHSVIADGAVITSNLAVERRVFDQVGVFDTQFRAPWCEDADLFYRLRKAGVSIAYDSGIRVDHPPRYQSFRSYLRKTRFLQFYGLIAKKHPDQEPFRLQGPRLAGAAKKVVLLGVFSIVWAGAAGLPWPLAVAAAPAPYCLVDARRLVRIKRELEVHGVSIPASDQALFVALNWATNLAEGYYLLKGWLRYHR